MAKKYSTVKIGIFIFLGLTILALSSVRLLKYGLIFMTSRD